MKKELKIIFYVLIFGLVCNALFAAKNTEDKELTTFLNELKTAVKSGNNGQILKLIKFPIIIGSGGDAFYNYESVNENDFEGNYLNEYIINYRKKLAAISQKKLFKVKKDGNNLTSFTYGANDDSMSDGIDYASIIPDGTTVYQYEFCQGKNGPCTGYFFSKFDGVYKLWGITFGN
jgi:hypothetical protein